MRRLLTAFSERARPDADGQASSLDFSLGPSRTDAHEFYAQARKAGPVCFDAVNNQWMVVGYEAAVWALKHPEILSSKYTGDFDPLVVGNDPPAHTRYRKILARAMSGYDVAIVDSYTGEWMEHFTSRTAKHEGSFDAVADLACLLPEAFTGFMLGLDVAETQRLMSIRPNNRTQLTHSKRSVKAYFEQIVANVHSAKRDGVLGALRSLSGDDALSDAEIVGLSCLLWFAGTSTSTHFLPSLLLLVLRHPEAVEEIRADLSLLSAFINEALRMEGPIGVLPRKAVTDFDLMGMKIPANATVKICILAANGDPAVFPEPRQIHWNRPTVSLAFGHGIHFCLGAMIAKAMAAKVAEILLSQFPGMRAAQDLESVQYEPSDAFRALRSLRIELC